MPTSTQACDHQLARCVESTEATDEGRFREDYECPCGATGVITGREEDPAHKWNRYGEVFSE
jgi:hypothetical protein